MAEWNDNVKHPKSSINNGQQYTKDDNVTLESLNNTIENSFYAVRVAENAQSATNNAVSYNAQTPLATEQIQAQKNLGIDQTIVFAESERQKSKNLLDINKAELKANSQTHSTLSNGTLTINNSEFSYISSLTNLCDLKPNIPYTLSYVTNNGYSYIYQYYDGGTGFKWNNGETKIFSQVDIDRIADNLLLFYGSTNSTVTYSNIQIEEGSTATDYQPYNGQITHNGDPAVEFAEKEYQKSKNLIPYPYYDGNSIVSNGITFTANNDQSISVSGSIVDHNSNAVMWLAWDMPLKAGNYRISDSNSSNDLSVVAWIGNDYYQKDVNNGMFTLSSDTTARIYLQVAKGSTKTYNDTIRFMLCEGTDTDWQPYNGAIVHEKDIEPILIYDKDTKNTIGGTPYTAGLYTSGLYIKDNIPDDVTRLRIYYANQYVSIIDNGGTHNVCELDIRDRNTAWCETCVVNAHKSDADATDDTLFKLLLAVDQAGYMNIKFFKNTTKIEDGTSCIYRIEGLK